MSSVRRGIGPWSRGRVLGGSSSINGLLYVRGQREDFDHWRQLGNTGWGWDDVAPVFTRMEGYERGDSALRGRDGPLAVSDLRLFRPEIDAWVRAAEAAGYRRNDDYNGERQEGVGYFQFTARGGRRCSSAVAYLRPAKDRASLAVVTGAQAARVLIDDGRATGVEVIEQGGRHRLAPDPDAVRRRQAG